jgi:hypothetical protein
MRSCARAIPRLRVGSDSNQQARDATGGILRASPPWRIPVTVTVFNWLTASGFTAVNRIRESESPTHGKCPWEGPSDVTDARGGEMSFWLLILALNLFRKRDRIDWKDSEWGAASLAGFFILYYGGYYWTAVGFSIISSLFTQVHSSHLENRHWQARGRVSGPTSWREDWSGDWGREKWDIEK